MPAPKNVESIDSPAINVPPPPSVRMERNNGAAMELEKAKKSSYRETLNREADQAEKEREERILRADQAGQPVLDEANRGEEAWHKAMKNRGNEEMQRRRNGGETDIDKLRKGEIDGKPRENSPEDLGMAAEIRGTAEDIKLDRTKKQEPKPSESTDGERLADLGNQKDV